MSAAPGPEISVVVPSHERPLRLRWLLNALEEQTLERSRFEVVVVHDSGDDTDELLRTHPLGVRHERLARGSGLAGRKRNMGWRLARAPLVAFTDDDCRPPEGWLSGALAAAGREPGAIVQGATRPDPDELGLVRAPGWRSLTIDPPVAWAQTCNIVYPRTVLEATGGFDEAMTSGEDTELALRAIAGGTRYAGAPEVLTYHCVEVPPLSARVRGARRWASLPLVVKRHPGVRRLLPLGIFWKPRHAWLGPALAGVALAPRWPLAFALVLPWAAKAAPSYGPGPRGRLRAVTELPAAAVLDVAEVAALARGSVRHRTLFL